jgi:hypothetical protein
MSEGFIRGGAGDVDMLAILPPSLRGFSTRAQQEAAAEAYESKHPNVIVRRPWEDEKLHAERRKGRKINARPQPTIGMDPDRAARELRRVYANLEGLSVEHPEYDKLWGNWTREANQLEDICGLDRTTFQKGARAKRNDDPIPAALQEKLNEYVALKDKLRIAALKDEEDVRFLRLAKENEPLSKIQELIITKLAQLGAL